jgi:hypothetical protein
VLPRLTTRTERRWIATPKFLVDLHAPYNLKVVGTYYCTDLPTPNHGRPMVPGAPIDERFATQRDGSKQIETALPGAFPVPPLSFPMEASAPPGDPIVRAAIHRAFGGICFWTRQQIALHEMHIDHVWAKSRGGPDNIFNYVPATGPANLTKKDTFDIEAVTAVLAFVRLTYGPRVLTEVAAARLRAASLKAAWWRISERRIVPEREDALVTPESSLPYGVENCRREIADFLRNSPLDEGLRPDWDGLVIGASAEMGCAAFSDPADFRRAWLATIMAPRIGVRW